MSVNNFKISKIFYLITFSNFLFLYYSTNTDSLSCREKIFVRLSCRAIYINRYFRGSNFVRRIELSHVFHKRINVGATIFWGWRFGKNFGKNIDGYYTNVRSKPINKPLEDKPYSFNEWFKDRVLDWGPGYALNYKYQGYGLFLEYQLDKNGIGHVFNKRKIHLNALIGLSYVQGEVAGNLLYAIKEHRGIGFGGNEYDYYFVYEKIKYINISLDMMIKLNIQPKKNDFILPGFTLYYFYSPEQVNYGMKNFGWMWDVKIHLWKK